MKSRSSPSASPRVDAHKFADEQIVIAGGRFAPHAIHRRDADHIRDRSRGHRSQKTWRAGRLVSLSSETVEQGETLHVEGAAMPQGFRDEQGQCRYRIPCHLDVKQLVDPSDAGAGDGGYRRI